MLREYVEQRFGGAAMEYIDGSTAAAPRHDAVTRFNSPDATSFLFLSVTRCCGLGTHLPTVTSVVLFDSDWDPRSDVQVCPPPPPGMGRGIQRRKALRVAWVSNAVPPLLSDTCFWSCFWS